MKRTLSLFLLAFAAGANAAPFISEMYRNPDGADDNREFFEIQANANESLDGLFLLNVEGDPGSGSGVGSIDRIISLAGKSAGANGLYLFQYQIPDFNPAPSPLTAVDRLASGSFENGDATWLLVRNYTGSLVPDETDLDTDNDGVLDSKPWSEVVDGFGITEEAQASGVLYASQLGLFSAPVNLPWQTTAYVRTGDGARFILDTDGAGFGPYTLEGSNFVSDTPGAVYDPAWTLTPGSLNPVPEPAAFAAFAVGAAALLRRRRA